MKRTYPDIEWYSARSEERGIPVRCPHANVHSCPRYYQSLALLGEAGITTRIDPKTDEALLKKWEVTAVWPVVNEHATSVINKTFFSNFCPEVSFDAFRLFASYLAKYSDETGKEAAEKRLVANGRANAKDWAWNWRSVSEMHYAECPLYSQLPPHELPKPEAQKSEEIVTLKPSAFGISVDVKRLLSRLAKWWLERNKL